ncbi:hypothetical protein [Candidatus Frankia nodulisporulans]|uniref:hypothetical protein n=1 Tax=Candidatus Frankia nodulisporulans TaxID=2060052 RepID=UPI0013D00F37|nr:hypothetical protein [Candidatus Frankia nodulisporulans]
MAGNIHGELRQQIADRQDQADAWWKRLSRLDPTSADAIDLRGRIAAVLTDINLICAPNGKNKNR